MTSAADVVTCKECGLRQFLREKCRRCGHLLPGPEILVRVVEKIVEKKIEVPVALECVACTVFTDDFPTFEVMERRLYVKAFERASGNPLKMAELLGLGKTTVYRHLKEMREAGELPEIAQ
jgi:DNA-binding NtrC family response regulator